MVQISLILNGIKVSTITLAFEKVVILFEFLFKMTRGIHPQEEYLGYQKIYINHIGVIAKIESNVNNKFGLIMEHDLNLLRMDLGKLQKLPETEPLR
jgi:hypothetical protein